MTCGLSASWSDRRFQVGVDEGRTLTKVGRIRRLGSLEQKMWGPLHLKHPCHCVGGASRRVAFAVESRGMHSMPFFHVTRAFDSSRLVIIETPPPATTNDFRRPTIGLGPASTQESEDSTFSDCRNQNGRNGRNARAGPRPPQCF